MREDFYEPDEPVDKIKAAFARGRKERTEAPQVGMTTYLAVAGYSLRPASSNEPNGERLSAAR